MNYLKIGALLLTAFVTWYATSDHYQKQLVEVQLDTAQAVQQELLKQQENIRLAGEQHAKDQTVINALRDRPERVRVVFPQCGGDTCGEENTDGRAGALSGQVDRVFAEFQEEVGRLVFRCDQLNIDAIEMNGATR